MLGIAQPFGFATPTFILEPLFLCFTCARENVLRRLLFPALFIGVQMLVRDVEQLCKIAYTIAAESAVISGEYRQRLGVSQNPDAGDKYEKAQNNPGFAPGL